MSESKSNTKPTVRDPDAVDNLAPMMGPVCSHGARQSGPLTEHSTAGVTRRTQTLPRLAPRFKRVKTISEKARSDYQGSIQSLSNTEPDEPSSPTSRLQMKLARSVLDDKFVFRGSEPEDFFPGFRELESLVRQKADTCENDSNTDAIPSMSVDYGCALQPAISRIEETSLGMLRAARQDLKALAWDLSLFGSLPRNRILSDTVLHPRPLRSVPHSPLARQRWRAWQRFRNGLVGSTQTKDDRLRRRQRGVKLQACRDRTSSSTTSLTLERTAQDEMNVPLCAPNAAFRRGERGPLSLSGDDHRKPLVVVLGGGTGVGKTAVSLELARALDGEIVSADSVQVYRGFDIGSAKITREEMRGVRHHLIDTLDVGDGDYSAGQFFRDATRCIEDIISRGKTPIVVGGTGMYLRWLLYGPPVDVPAPSEVVQSACKLWVSLLHSASVGSYFLTKAERRKLIKTIDREIDDRLRGMSPEEQAELLKPYLVHDDPIATRDAAQPWMAKVRRLNAIKLWKENQRQAKLIEYDRAALAPFMSVLNSEFIAQQNWKPEVREWIFKYLRAHDTHRLEKALAFALETRGQVIPRAYKQQLVTVASSLAQGFEQDAGKLPELSKMESSDDSASLASASDHSQTCHSSDPSSDAAWREIVAAFEHDGYSTPPIEWQDRVLPGLMQALGKVESTTAASDLAQHRLRDRTDMGALNRWDTRCLYLVIPRDLHYVLTDLRCESMIQQGLYRECATLVQKGAMSPTSVRAKAIGYRQVLDALADPYIRRLWVRLRQLDLEASIIAPTNDGLMFNGEFKRRFHRITSEASQSSPSARLRQLTDLLTELGLDRSDFWLALRAGRSYCFYMNILKSTTRRFTRKQYAWFITETAYRFVSIPMARSTHFEVDSSSSMIAQDSTDPVTRSSPSQRPFSFELDPATPLESKELIEFNYANYKSQLTGVIPDLVKLMMLPEEEYWRDFKTRAQPVQRTLRSIRESAADTDASEGAGAVGPGARFTSALRSGNEDAKQLAAVEELEKTCELICALAEIEDLPPYMKTPEGYEACSIIAQGNRITEVKAETTARRDDTIHSESSLEDSPSEGRSILARCELLHQMRARTIATRFDKIAYLDKMCETLDSLRQEMDNVRLHTPSTSVTLAYQRLVILMLCSGRYEAVWKPHSTHKEGIPCSARAYEAYPLLRDFCSQESYLHLNDDLVRYLTELERMFADEYHQSVSKYLLNRSFTPDLRTHIIDTMRRFGFMIQRQSNVRDLNRKWAYKNLFVHWRFIDEFVNNILRKRSHELRSPLTSDASFRDDPLSQNLFELVDFLAPSTVAKRDTEMTRLPHLMSVQSAVSPHISHADFHCNVSLSELSLRECNSIARVLRTLPSFGIWHPQLYFELQEHLSALKISASEYSDILELASIFKFEQSEEISSYFETQPASHQTLQMSSCKPSFAWSCFEAFELNVSERVMAVSNYECTRRMKLGVMKSNSRGKGTLSLKQSPTRAVNSHTTAGLGNRYHDLRRLTLIIRSPDSTSDTLYRSCLDLQELRPIAERIQLLSDSIRIQTAEH